MDTNTKRLGSAAALVATSILVAGLAAGAASAVVVPGTPAKDVHVGLDNDTRSNTFIQPPGVTARQDMDRTDVVFGRGNDDLLVGNRGSDTLLGGPGSDILVGGPDHGATPSSDVLDGDLGDDVGIWSPGDGNDVFVGYDGTDTMILGDLATTAGGTLRLTKQLGREVPHVTVDGLPHDGCDLVPVPESEHLGVQYLVRFTVDGVITSTIRLKDVERVLCPSPNAGHGLLATLTDPHPGFHDVDLGTLAGLTRAIVGPQG